MVRLICGCLLALGCALALAIAPAGAQGAVTTELVSIGAPGFPNDEATSFGGTSTDGQRVVFDTAAPLTADDTDTAIDVYERFNGVTTMLSDRVQAGSDANLDARIVETSTDAITVVFHTDEPITAGDDDSVRDLYKHSAGSTTLVSDRVGADQEVPANLAGSSSDLSRIFFATDESLIVDDGDSAQDIYQRFSGTTTLISDRVQAGADQEKNVTTMFQGVTPDGTHVLLLTNEPLTSDDGDTDSSDVYDASGGTVSLVSDAVAAPDAATGASFGYIAADGLTTVFLTSEPITSDDGDASADYYRRKAGVTTLISDREQAGPDAAEGASDLKLTADGTKAFYETEEPLVSADTDSSDDVYEYDSATGNSTIQTDDIVGPDPDDSDGIHLEAISANGSHLFFETSINYLGTDTDGSSSDDLYVKTGGVVKQLTTIGGTDDAQFQAASADGSRAVFRTADAMVPADGDGTADDLYLADGSAVTLVSDRVAGGADSSDGATYKAASTAFDKIIFETDEEITEPLEGDLEDDLFRTTITPDPAPGQDPSPNAPLPPPASPKDAIASAATIGSLKLDSKGKVSAKLTCPATETQCSFNYELASAKAVVAKRKAKILKFGKGKASAAGGKSVTVKLKLSKKNFSYIKRKRKLSTKLSVTTTDAAGNSAKSSKKATLKSR